LRLRSPHSADDPSARREAFTRSDPQFYIDPTLGRNVDAEQFIEGGRGVVEQVLEWTGELGAYDLPENVRLHVLSGQDLDAFDSESVCFVFSHLVFQHVTDDAIVESYLREIARVLRPGGVAAVQFDTRRTRLFAGLVQRLPDPLLQDIRRRGIRRHRRPASQTTGSAEPRAWCWTPSGIPTPLSTGFAGALRRAASLAIRRADVLRPPTLGARPATPRRGALS
jgi:SAM-dependent methyltransferase